MFTFKETLERQREGKVLTGCQWIRTRGINPKESFRGRPGDLCLEWKRMSLGANLLFKDSCQDDEDSPEERQKREYRADSEYYSC